MRAWWHGTVTVSPRLPPGCRYALPTLPVGSCAKHRLASFRQKKTKHPTPLTHLCVSMHRYRQHMQHEAQHTRFHTGAAVSALDWRRQLGLLPGEQAQQGGSEGPVGKTVDTCTAAARLAAGVVQPSTGGLRVHASTLAARAAWILHLFAPTHPGSVSSLPPPCPSSPPPLSSLTISV